MDELKTLTDFATSSDPIIADAAQKIVALIGQAKDEKITVDELKELAGDILDLDTVDKLAESIETRVKIKAAFEVMGQLVSVIPFGQLIK